MTKSPDSSTKIKIVTLKKRAEFLKAGATDRKYIRPAFVLQAYKETYKSPKSTENQPENPELALHIGFTATKRLGGAVIRNRAKRRLRELARLVLTTEADLSYHYVLIAREAVLTQDFAKLTEDMKRAAAYLKSVKSKKPPEISQEAPLSSQK